MAVSFSMFLTMFILFTTVLLEGAFTCFQAAATEHLAAVSIAEVSLVVGAGRSSIGLPSTYVRGSKGISWPRVSSRSLRITAQNLWISGHVHQMWAMSPFCPHPLQHRSTVPGKIWLSLLGVRYH
ncbi:hypothetical protein FKM82_017542 [Ascaphus truei]